MRDALGEMIRRMVKASNLLLNRHNDGGPTDGLSK